MAGQKLGWGRRSGGHQLFKKPGSAACIVFRVAEVTHGIFVALLFVVAAKLQHHQRRRNVRQAAAAPAQHDTEQQLNAIELRQLVRAVAQRSVRNLVAHHAS